MDHPFIGRTTELDNLERTVRLAATRRHPTVAFIEGESGVGKSSLVEHAIDRLGRRGFTVASGCGDRIDRGRPFWLFEQAIGPLTPGSSTSASFDDEARGRADEIADRIVSIGADGPTLLFLDDVQWADTYTIRALPVILHRAAALPVAVVVAARTGSEASEIASLVEDLARFQPLHVRLRPFDDAAIVELATAYLGRTLSSREIHRLDAAGGNPLYLTHLLTAMKEGGGLPDSLRELVLRRIDQLGENVAGILRVAAVLGRSFDVAELSSILGRPPSDLVVDLDRALSAGILVGEDRRLAFSHDVLRDALYEQTAPGVRAALHRQIAEALDGLGAAPSRLVTHVAAAEIPLDDEWIDRLGRVCSRLELFSAAPDLLRHAERLPKSDPRRIDILAALAWPLAYSARFDEADRVIRELLEEGAGTRDGRVVRALTRLLTLQERHDELATRISELERGDPTDAVRSALLRYRIDEALIVLGDAQGGLVLVDQAIALARGLQDDAAHGAAECLKATALLAQGYVGDAIALARQGCARYGGRFATLYLGIALIDADEFAEATSVLDALLRYASISEVQDDQAWAHTALAGVFYFTGDLARCEAEARAVISDPRPFGGVAIARSFLARSLLHRGGDGLAAEALPGENPIGLGNDLVGWVRGFAAEHEHGVGPALDAMAEGWRRSAGVRFFIGWRSLTPEIVRLAVRAGRTSLAREATEAATTGAERSGLPSAVATMLRCRGLLERDVGALRASIERYDASPRILDGARAREDAAALMSGAERISTLTQALDSYRAVDAGADARRVQTTLRASGWRAPSASARPDRGWESLTTAELEVVRFVTTGLTNREVAERLSVSPHTVGTHLKHVYTKLGVSTRTELATEAARRTS